MKKIIYSILLFISLLFIARNHAYAKDPIDYYINLHKARTISVDKPIMSKTNDAFENFKSDVDNFKFLVVMSSQAKKVDITKNNPYITTIVICNEDIIFNTDIRCGYDFVSVESDAAKYKTLARYDWYMNDIKVANTTIGNNNFIFVPEMYYLSPNFAGDVLAYIESLSESVKTNELATSKLKNNLFFFNKLNLNNDYINDLVAIMIFASVFYIAYLVTKFIFGDSKLTTEEKISAIKLQVLKILKKAKPIIMSSLLFILFILLAKRLIFSAALNTILLIVKRDFPNIGDYLQNLQNVLIEQYLLPLGVFLAFLYFLPGLFEVHVKQKADTIQFRKSFLKMIFPSILILLILTSLVTNFFSAPILVLILTILYAYILFLVKYKSDSKTIIYSVREKKVLGVIIIATIAFSSIYLLKLDNKYTYKKLFNQNLRIITLPNLILDIPRTLYVPYHVTDFKNNIFADNYMVFSPSYKKITHKPSGDYKGEDNYYLLADKKIETLQRLSQIADFKTLMSTQDLNENFYVKETLDYRNTYYLNITVNCNNFDLGPNNIDVSYFDDFKKKLDTKRLLSFPGCNQGENKTYRVPLSPKVLNRDQVYRIEAMDFPSITDISINEANNNENLITYIKKLDKINPYTVFKHEKTKDGTLFVFYPYYKDVEEFNIDDNNKFDIANNINQLIRDKLIKSKFIVWSDDFDVIMNPVN